MVWGETHIRIPLRVTETRFYLRGTPPKYNNSCRFLKNDFYIKYLSLSINLPMNNEFKYRYSFSNYIRSRFVPLSVSFFVYSLHLNI